MKLLLHFNVQQCYNWCMSFLRVVIDDLTQIYDMSGNDLEDHL